MIQYQETKYENAGEYLNWNAMIELDSNQRKKMISDAEKAINELKSMMNSTEFHSDDWYNLRDQVMEYEEQIEECTNEIAENTRKIRENQQAARKTRIELEDMIEEEIQNRIQRYRDMVDGSVQMQDIMTDAIRQRYQDEWDLISKDIDKKKEALEQEKSLIDERLNKRKEAEDEAAKYEELAELRRQYAMISMDSTRTKDAAEMREKMEKLEKELSWNIAENEAKAQGEGLQDQIDAYDQYQQNTEDDLQAYLEDANNFADEINSVLKGSQEDLMNWLSANVKDYANSLNDAQLQLLLSWEDTYKQMMGITDTWWEEINKILTDEDSNASDMNQEYMTWDWEDMYRAYVSAWLTGATYAHDDDFNGYGQAAGGGGGGGGGGGKKKPTYVETTTNAGGKGEVGEAIEVNGRRYYVPTSVPVADSGVMKPVYVVPVIHGRTNATGSGLANISSKLTSKYASGGVVDYTGPAWVDGTPTHPEAFLSADDTALMRSMLDAAKYATVRPTISNIDGSNFNGAGMTVGDINITITEAEFKDNADYEAVAERVGEAFLKELNKEGLNLAKYAI